MYQPLYQLQFVLGYGIESWLIARGSAGHFSHVDAVLPNGSLLGARSDRIGLPTGIKLDAGVQVRPPFYESWKKRVVMTLPITRAQEEKHLEFLYAQIGKPYDFTGIYDFFTGEERDWRQDDSWFCSELQGSSGENALVFPVLYTPSCKLTPSALATVMSALGATIS